MPTLQLFWKRCRRTFRRPLQTAHGEWRSRTTLILRLDDGTHRGYGEVAPLTAFGSESLERAEAFLDTLRGSLTREKLARVSDSLPCCQFALESAMRQIEASDGLPARTWPVAGLLPAGPDVLEALPELEGRNYEAVKWKIGVEEPMIEWDLLGAVHQALPPDCELRVDANSSLDVDTARGWLERLEALTRPCLLEQPLRPGMEDIMDELREVSSVCIALDESAGRAASLRRPPLSLWRGGWVIKPMILGAERHWRAFREERPRDPVIFSSAFETAFGVENVLEFIRDDPGTPKALGFGTLDAFEDDGLTLHPPGASITSGQIPLAQLDALWQQL
ncbi:MAG: o-succinylbenzoate synthase [Verrucomicrobiota bacterium]